MDQLVNWTLLIKIPYSNKQSASPAVKEYFRSYPKCGLLLYCSLLYCFIAILLPLTPHSRSVHFSLSATKELIPCYRCVSKAMQQLLYGAPLLSSNELLPLHIVI